MYPIAIRDGVLHIVARMRVARISTIQDYLRDELQIPEELLSLHLWELEKRLIIDYLHLGHKVPQGCVNEAIVGELGTAISFDRPLPGNLLPDIRFRSGTKERGLKHVVNGRLVRSVDIQGHVFRLSTLTSELTHKCRAGGRSEARRPVRAARLAARSGSGTVPGGSRHFSPRLRLLNSARERFADGQLQQSSRSIQ